MSNRINLYDVIYVICNIITIYRSRLFCFCSTHNMRILRKFLVKCWIFSSFFSIFRKSVDKMKNCDMKALPQYFKESSFYEYHIWNVEYHHIIKTSQDEKLYDGPEILIIENSSYSPMKQIFDSIKNEIE